MLVCFQYSSFNRLQFLHYLVANVGRIDFVRQSGRYCIVEKLPESISVRNSRKKEAIYNRYRSYLDDVGTVRSRHVIQWQVVFRGKGEASLGGFRVFWNAKSSQFDGFVKSKHQILSVYNCTVDFIGCTQTRYVRPVLSQFVVPLGQILVSDLSRGIEYPSRRGEQI